MMTEINIILKSAVIIGSFMMHYLFSGALKRISLNIALEIAIARLAGGILYGIPAILFFMPDALLADKEIPKTILFALFFSALAIMLNFFRTKTREERTVFPEIRLKKWPVNVILLNGVSWAFYLLPYEFALRGNLFLAAASQSGPLSAAFLNALVYSVIHIGKGWQQIIGAFPFGILLCYITWTTGTFWPAFVIHLALAVSNDHFFLIENSIKPIISLKR